MDESSRGGEVLGEGRKGTAEEVGRKPGDQALRAENGFLVELSPSSQIRAAPVYHVQSSSRAVVSAVLHTDNNGTSSFYDGCMSEFLIKNTFST